MKSRTLKRIPLILFLLLTSFFLPFSSLVLASYPTLSKNGFMDNSVTVYYQKDGLMPGQYLIAQDTDVLFPKEKSFSSPISAPITKSSKSNGAGFRLSASLGFCEIFYSNPYADMTEEKPGLTYKLSGDYWFGNHLGLGVELIFFNLFGSGYSQNENRSWYILTDEFNYYISPNIKLSLALSSWRLFSDLGIGVGGAEYSQESVLFSRRLFIKFGLGWSIKIGKNYETGLIIDYKYIGYVPDSTYQTDFINIFLLSASPFIGYVF